LLIFRGQNVDQYTIDNLSLCSGGAGLDLGLELALGGVHTVCWVEWEAFAIEYLAAAMQADCLAQAPIWTDLRTFDGRPWRGTVDCVTAGYPCQPFSIAGKRRGQNDPRHLWPHVHRIIGEVEPSLVFLENVPGHLSLGFGEVAEDLESLGYQVAAGLFSAEEVGASHKRERLFILAVANACHQSISSCGSSGEMAGTQGQTQDRTEKWEWMRDTFAYGCATLGDAYGHVQGRGNVEGRSAKKRIALGRAGKNVAESEGQRFQIESGPSGDIESQLPAVERSSLPLFPPGPDQIERWQRVLEIDPTLEPSICSMADGLAEDRTHYLRLLGNGVVPLQAAYAFVSLWSALRSE
jgi:DNA (cytosine-5)-methyltransferase 1